MFTPATWLEIISDSGVTVELLVCKKYIIIDIWHGCDVTSSFVSQIACTARSYTCVWQIFQ